MKSSSKNVVRGTGGLLPISFADSILPAPQQSQQQFRNTTKNSKYLEADIFEMIKRCLTDVEKH